MRFRTNQTTWMVQVWDEGTNGFSDFWEVSTWSKSRKAGLKAGKECLVFNRGINNIPRWKLIHLKDNNIKNLFISY